MSNRVCLCILAFSMVTLMHQGAVAQTDPEKKNAIGHVVTVTFAFKTAPAGVVGHQGADGDNRFYIEVPTSNKPTISVSAIESVFEIRRENNRLDTGEK